jgi:hypothetical protein
MKKALLLSMVLVSGIFSSCQKCIECTYEYQGEKFSSGEICGNSKDIEETKKNWESSAKTFGATATCLDR